MACIPHDTRVQRRCVRFLVSLNGIQDMRTGQLRTVTETRKVQSHVKDIFPLHESLQRLNYPRVEVAVKD